LPGSSFRIAEVKEPALRPRRAQPKRPAQERRVAT